MLVAYITGHGFGHFVRASAVLSRLPDVTIHLCTNGRAFSLADRASWAASIRKVDVGPGVVQLGPLASDVAATRRALEQHLHDWPRLVDEEAAFLRDCGARLVFGDVPPLAFAAAARAGIPSVAMANFSWSWIYDGFVAVDPWFAGAAAHMRQAEAQATLLLALEMGGGLDSFPRHQPILPVARPVLHSREATLAALGLEEKARALPSARSASGPPRERGTFVLFSLGGFGEDLEVAVSGSSRHQLLVTSARLTNVPPGVTLVEPSDHHELVAAVDCIIGKPGYGIVAECLRKPTPFCYLPRGDFREWAPLSDGIQRWLPNAPITLDDLRTGRWTEVVDRAIASTPREKAPIPDGAIQAAATLKQLQEART